MSANSNSLDNIGDYKFGFRDPETYVFKSRRGLSKEVVEQISDMKGEPQWMLDFRLKALDHFQKRPIPTWGGDLSGLDLDNIFYYVKPAQQSKVGMKCRTMNTFNKLGIQKRAKFLWYGLNMKVRWWLQYTGAHQKKDYIASIEELVNIRHLQAYFGKVIPMKIINLRH
jgi:Fe-S cluster assembly protein SufB